MNENNKKNQKSCPYCGSKKFSKVDYPWAEWECDVCNNTFKSPYWPGKYDTPKFPPSKPRKKTITDYLEEALGFILKMLIIGTGLIILSYFVIMILITIYHAIF